MFPFKKRGAVISTKPLIQLMEEKKIFEVLAFGIAREIVGGPRIAFELSEKKPTAGSLKKALEDAYPRLKALNALAVAVNSEYAAEEDLIHPTDELALIPPVSGG